VLVLQAFIAFFRVQGFIRSGESALNRLRRDLFAHLVRLPMSFFHEQRAGALSNRISADLGVVRDTLLTTVPQAVRQTVILVGGLIFIFIASWKLSLIMLGSVPVVVLAIAFFGRKVRGYSKAAQDSLADAGTVIEETVQGIADVKAFTNEPFETPATAARSSLPRRDPARREKPRGVPFVHHLRVVRHHLLCRLVRRAHAGHGEITTRTSFPSSCSRSSSGPRSGRFRKSSPSSSKPPAPPTACASC
jgi:ABC-type multidrug transport system fused ATPase/permease subunit